jgi:hypothetical protein
MPEIATRSEDVFTMEELTAKETSEDDMEDSDNLLEVSFMEWEQITPDADGYYPPKYLILDGGIQDLVSASLEEYGLPSKEYECDCDDYDDIHLQDFVVAERYKNPRYALEHCKATLVTVCVRRRGAAYDAWKKKHHDDTDAEMTEDDDEPEDPHSVASVEPENTQINSAY